MRALTLVADRKIELAERPPPPPPAASEVQIRIRAVALNHIDVWGWRGMAFAKRKLPLVVGAEAAGEVAAAGPGARVDATAGERGIYGSDAQLDGSGLPGPRSSPVRLTSAALDPTQLPPAADPFRAAFAEAYGRRPGRYAAYGYEAMAAILAAIDRAEDPTSRGDVVDEFFAIEDRDSILGRYSIDGVGDTTLRAIGAYAVLGTGRPRPTPEPLVLP